MVALGQECMHQTVAAAVTIHVKSDEAQRGPTEESYMCYIVNQIKRTRYIDELTLNSYWPIEFLIKRGVMRHEVWFCNQYMLGYHIAIHLAQVQVMWGGVIYFSEEGARVIGVLTMDVRKYTFVTFWHICMSVEAHGWVERAMDLRSNSLSLNLNANHVLGNFLFPTGSSQPAVICTWWYKRC